MTRIDKNVSAQLNDIKQLAAMYLPSGKARAVQNKCDKVTAAIKRSLRIPERRAVTMDDDRAETVRQVYDRESAKQAIFEAMMAGRRISLLDSREYEVSQMHTVVVQIRRDIESAGLPYEMKNRWMTFGDKGKRCKEYWLEKNEEGAL